MPAAPSLAPPEGAFRRPRRLRAGSRVAVVAPSSGFLEPSDLDRGLAVLRSFGLEPVVAPTVLEVRGYLAGPDERRADDLLRALGDPTVDAVWCARGGYGAQRTVAALDLGALEAIASGEPKAVIGFSDITVIHALVGRRLGWVSFYGPVVSTLRPDREYRLAGVRRALFDAEPFVVPPNPDDDWVTTLVPGRAEGVLAGGCLSLLASLAGTPLQVDFAGKVAFFEDVDEPPYSIDRYLSQLLAAGCFDGCLGIAIGDHANTTMPGGSSLGLEQVFSDLLRPLGVPCCFYLPLGHGRHMATLPIGTTVALDADAGTLEVLQPGVR